ncbi:MAG: bifunctional phosphoribosylaminoimidazolecarboxamide formyltransferase/IMP cyclohydrolase [Rhodospirillaceae bacterium]|jgi:phosphoribosylaminoimidazolecarboxamide formyltransferase/IMP cyclohydrolase|nr:bifunctional phosphoribosylaminoimidazolecarboxamide formyltransferase/IMP cyclohydrolase [Rhodospirillaceae bacterium]
MNEPIIRRALISVSDKTNLIYFAKFLIKKNVELLSTGGSAKTLRDAGLSVIEVSDHTGLPEMFDGRVKTLNHKIHGGILNIRDNSQHKIDMIKHDISQIDLVIVNLYPFEKTITKNSTFENCVENIDIGGSALIRAAAKNHQYVAVVVDISDYQEVIDAMIEGKGSTTLELRYRLATTAYAHTSAYDSMISKWFSDRVNDSFPRRITISAKLKQTLRYGENPHQDAALYLSTSSRPGVANSKQLQGKELSFNNINDTDTAFELVSEFNSPAVAIIKHANPCGVAIGHNLLEAYDKALACDPISAFGGIVALNRPIDLITAEKIIESFTEVVIAPEINEIAQITFAKKKNLRLLVTGSLPDPNEKTLTIRTISGGYLLQSRDSGSTTMVNLKIVTKRQPTQQELNDLLFAFRVCKYVKSNAIVYAKYGVTVGIGAGQMSRVDSSHIATWKSNEKIKKSGLDKSEIIDSVVASDAFFPFVDALLVAIKAGVTAVIQPGGSMHDAEIIAFANDANLTMAFTGIRHFRH